MSERFAEKVAIVTGAASGIGFAVATQLAQEGARVVAVDSNEARLKRFDRIPSVVQEAADISDEVQVKGLVAAVLGRYGCIDVLVNSAAVFDMTPLEEASDAAIAQSERVNVAGTQSMLDEVAGAMSAGRTHGAIVNIASVSGMGQEADKTVYSKTKAAILEMTASAAVQLGGRGIRVNAVSPGPILTEASYKHMEQAGVSEVKFIEGAQAATVIGRMGTPEEVARAVLFLASNAEASYITGTNLVVDGGFNAMQQSTLAP